MASQDPWFWSAPEVGLCFRHSLHRLVTDLPNPIFPDTEHLSVRLEAQGVNGWMLLSRVDRAFLKDECAISSFGALASVEHAIDCLRQGSPAYANWKMAPPSALPSNLLQQEPPMVQPQTPESPHTSVVGTIVRQNEVTVIDETGRKRRRLDLSSSASQPVSSKSTSSTLASTTPAPSIGYYRNEKMPLNDVFYQSTAVGKEMSSDYEDDSDNFDLTPSHPINPGDAQYISKQLKHFLSRPAISEIRYRGKQTIARYPYRKGIIDDASRSVTLFQHEKGPIREKANAISFQQDFALEATSESSWDRLLSHHQQSANDKVITIEGYSSDDEMENEPTVFDDESDSDMAEEEEDPSAITQEQVLEIIDTRIEEMIAAWVISKQPQCELKRAQTVWRQMHGKRFMREYLISRSRKEISRYSDRLANLKDWFMKESYASEQQLKAACEIMEVTVHEREQERWKISVWRRQQEPEGMMKPRKKKVHLQNHDEMMETDQAEAHADGLGDFVENDSVSGTMLDVGQSVEEDALDFSFIYQEIEKDAFQETKTVHEDKYSGDAVQTSADLPDDNNGSAQTPEHSDDNLMTGMSNDPSPVSLQSQIQEVMDEDDDMEMIDLPTATIPVNQAVEADRNEIEEQAADDSDADLPLLSMFKPRISQSAIQKPKPPIEVIELSSDPSEAEDHNVARLKAESFTQLPSKFVKQEKQIEFSSDPDRDSISLIQQWDFAILEEKDDRKRIIMKLIYEMDTDDQQILKPLLLLPPKVYFAAVKIACNVLHEEPEQYPHNTAENSQALRMAARLYSCWEYANHELWDAPATIFFGCDKKPQDFDPITMRPWRHTIKVTLDRIQKAKDAVENPRKTILISDSDSENDAKENRKKKKNRNVKVSESGEVLRSKARTRALAYSQQSSNTAQLSLMVSGGESGNDVVPIFAPVGSDETTHIYLNNEIASRLKPHQIEGVRFLWRELTSDDEEGQGCILAHTMGLGKTAQSIALLVTIAETAASKEKRIQLPQNLRTQKQKILVLCPPTLLPNWQQELGIWDQTHVLGETYVIDSIINDSQERFQVLRRWRERGGVLLIGYTMFLKFVTCKATKSLTEEDSLTAKKWLLKRSTLVIADEAHILRNEKSQISQAANQFFTQRRIALTGSPMSNNIQEIYTLVSWAAPGYLGSSEEFRSSYGIPIEAGTYLESTAGERRRSIKKLAALKEIIAPKLNRADITVLKGAIKNKVEYVLTVPLTACQEEAYVKYVQLVLGSSDAEDGNEITQARLFGWLSTLGLLCNHPWAFRTKLMEEKKVPKVPKDPKVPKKKGKTALRAAEPQAEPIDPARIGSPFAGALPSDEESDASYLDEHVTALGINDFMVQKLLPLLPEWSYEEFSHKAQLCRKIIELSVAANDKVLLFSHSIPTLDYLDLMVRGMGLRSGRIQGDISPRVKRRVLENMENGLYNVLLISTRAGGLGLNIQSANRVIIFNFGFNPTWEEQAIGRAYRLGQTKPVFVYRFVAGGTFESMLNNKALFKTGLASRVVDKKNPVRNAERNPSRWLFPPRTLDQNDIRGEIGKDPQVLDKILEMHGEDHDTYIRDVKTMETLQVEADDVPLTAEEQAEVQEEIAQAQAMKAKKVPFTSTAQMGLSTQSAATSGSTTSRPSTQAGTRM